MGVGRTRESLEKVRRETRVSETDTEIECGESAGL